MSKVPLQAALHEHQVLVDARCWNGWYVPWRRVNGSRSASLSHTNTNINTNTRSHWSQTMVHQLSSFFSPEATSATFEPLALAPSLYANDRGRQAQINPSNGPPSWTRRLVSRLLPPPPTRRTLHATSPPHAPPAREG